MRPRAVIIGAGIGGLAAAAGLHNVGWDVTVCERADALEPIGAGLAVAPNGLRALDTFGAGAAVRGLAVSQELGIRRRDGRWIMRSSSQAVAARFGDPVVLVTRAALVETVRSRVPADALRLSTEVLAVSPGEESGPSRVTTSVGDLDAELVVAADGIRSLVRETAFPGQGDLRYAGFTTWRMLTDPVGGTQRAATVPMAESWGPGSIFGVMPLSDGRVYCYGAARAAAGGRADDEHAELVRRFGDWHDPIPRLLASVPADRVLRHDVGELATPLPAFHQGRIALIGDAAHPMAPNLGQGGSQALEDAAVLAHLMTGADADAVPHLLAEYTSLRRPRADAIVRRSRQVARIGLLAARPAVAARDAAVLVVAKLMPSAGMRGLGPVYDWHPPCGQPC